MSSYSSWRRRRSPSPRYCCCCCCCCSSSFYFCWSWGPFPVLPATVFDVVDVVVIQINRDDGRYTLRFLARPMFKICPTVSAATITLLGSIQRKTEWELHNKKKKIITRLKVVVTNTFHTRRWALSTSTALLMLLLLLLLLVFCFLGSLSFKPPAPTTSASANRVEGRTLIKCPTSYFTPTPRFTKTTAGRRMSNTTPRLSLRPSSSTTRPIMVAFVTPELNKMNITKYIYFNNYSEL